MTDEMLENIRLILKPLLAQRTVITDEQLEEVFTLARIGISVEPVSIAEAPKDTVGICWGFAPEIGHFNTSLNKWVTGWDHRPLFSLTGFTSISSLRQLKSTL